MLTYFRFLLLSPQEKLVCLQETGTLLLNYVAVQGPLDLYALADFFVEVQYKENNASLMSVVAFQGLSRLQKHAEAISLTDLVAKTGK